MCCCTKVFPSFYSNEKACGEGLCVDQCANLNNLSPAARVKHRVVGRLLYSQKAGVSFIFFPACQGCGMHGENRSFRSSWWQAPQRPAFWLTSSWHPQGRTRWQVPRAVSSENEQAWHALYSEKQNLSKCHNLPTGSH